MKTDEHLYVALQNKEPIVTKYERLLLKYLPSNLQNNAPLICQSYIEVFSLLAEWEIRKRNAMKSD